MKKFSVIFQYLSRYKGKLVVYMIFNVLSIIFGLISLGMLSPFLDLLFGASAPANKSNLSLPFIVVPSLFPADRRQKEGTDVSASS